MKEAYENGVVKRSLRSLPLWADEVPVSETNALRTWVAISNFRAGCL